MDEDLEQLENDLVNEIAEETGLKEGKPEFKETKQSAEPNSYLEEVRKRLEDVIDVEANQEEVEGFLEDVQKRLSNGESIEDIRKDVEASLKDLDKSEEEEEDVIPASKHKKAIESMQKRIDDLYAQVKAREDRESKKDPNSDSRLEAMSGDELENLSDELDLALVEGELDGRELDTKGKRDVLALKRKVNNLIRTAPERAEKTKLENLSKVIPQIEKVVPDIREQLENKKGRVFELAMNVHNKSRSMQRSEMGYADAFVLAAEHIQALPSKSQDQLQSMRSRLNKLKSKTNLARSSSKGESTASRNNRLFEKAKMGGRDEQEAWILNTLVK